MNSLIKQFLFYRRNKNCKDRYKKESIEHITKSSMLFLCKFTDCALNLEITEDNIYNKDKICLSKIFISETEIKGGKQR